MNIQPKATRPSEFASHLYNFLLLLYPPLFRQIYGADMRLLFRDCLRDARRAGRNEVLSLWLSTIIDVCVSAPRAHIEEWTTMQASYTRTSRSGAIGAFVAAALWTMIMGVGDTYATFGQVFTNVLILGAVFATFTAIAALYFRLNVNQRSPFAMAGGMSGILALGVVLVSVVGGFINPEAEWLWYALMSAVGLLGLGLGLLGIAASTQPSLGILRFTPLLTLSMAVLMFLAVFYYSSIGEDIGDGIEAVTAGLALLGLLGTGTLLWTKAK